MRVNCDLHVLLLCRLARPPGVRTAHGRASGVVASDDRADGVARDAQLARDVALTAIVLAQRDDGPALLCGGTLAARRGGIASGGSGSSGECEFRNVCVCTASGEAKESAA